ncbi:phosphoglycerate dehydrogenase [Oceanobacillus sp. FSL K6-0251]|uniref:phosphoglycerate dehydrogenase n=1 Tax=Oceanobacillus sp. FSL K6-0251 TaxID=2921602 RepID=UPI0030FCB251
MSQQKKVLVTATNYSQLCAEAKQLLEKNNFEIIENPHDRPMKFGELKEIIGDIDAVVAGVDTWDESIIKLAPNLKVISRFGVGVDNINLDQAKEYGIQVTNAPRLNSNAVAELTVNLILNSLRNTVNLHVSTRQGHWERFVGTELKGKKVGLLGFGNIAQSVAKKLYGFDVELLAYDKFPNKEIAARYDVQFTSYEEILQASDIVSMHLPNLPETHHFMNKERFNQMKQGSYFVNTSRGALVDEKALYEALETGKLQAAAIDVYEKEPITRDNPLFHFDNIITTPHTAAESYEVYHSVGLMTAQAIISVFQEKTPDNLLN